MAYDVPQLLKMPQAQLDALFTASAARKIPNGEAQGTAIIAKVYKGPSWLDGKECSALDYPETSLVAGWIRDEIREIGPGLYLGRVYGAKKRLIDFALKF
jgi:hypothetical protein